MKSLLITFLLVLLLSGCVNVHVHFPQVDPPAAAATEKHPDK